MRSNRLFEKISSIELSSISKSYDGVFAVKELDLTIKGGELMVLIGPSGSGKTTTLRMINRLTEPDTGTISVDGRDISACDPVDLRRNMGYVIQQIGLFPHMTVGENIGIIPRLEGVDKTDAQERVHELLMLVDLPPEQYIERYPSELSGGQQQRVGLARALAMDPPILLMDEPFGALDPLLRMQLQTEFLKIKGELDKTIVFVTHDIGESMRLGDRICIMKDAMLEQVGTSKELIMNPASDFVSDIVGASEKLNHLGLLSLGDMGDILDPKFIVGGQVTAGDAVEHMLYWDIETIFLYEHGEEAYIATFNRLSSAPPDEKACQYSDPISILDPDMPLLDYLRSIKDNGDRLSLVCGKDMHIGYIRTDEILLKLV